jgi:hypothetical protein
VIAPPFRYRQLALLVSAALAGPGSALAAPAGNVDFAVGGVTVTGADGRTRPATKGLAVESGDRIVTTDGRAQIRFTDGAYVSLQPNTDFAVRDYRFDGKTDGSERGIFGLVRGALRTVTGAIGRVNRSAYQIQTPTATIGIRGTGGLIQVLGNGTTLVVSSSGIWTLTNPAGTLELPAGTAGEALPDPTQRPRETARGPDVPAPPPGPLEVALLPRPEGQALPPVTGPTTFVAGDKVTENGLPASLFGPLDCTTGCELAYAYLYTPFAVTVGQIGSVPATATGQITFSNGELVSFNDPAVSKSFTSAGITVDSGQADGVVAWGRWIGGSLNAGAGSMPLVTLPYVVGLPTPIADVKVNATYTYNLVGWTTPTNGALTGTVTGGQLVGNFGAAPTVNIVNFGVAIGANNYVINQSGLPIPAGGPYAPFSGSSTIFGGTCGGSGCTATVNGHFHGAGATHAGFAYLISNPSEFPNPDTVGAAVFKR